MISRAVSFREYSIVKRRCKFGGRSSFRNGKSEKNKTAEIRGKAYFHAFLRFSIVSNCGMQASMTVFRQISTHSSQNDRYVQIGGGAILLDNQQFLLIYSIYGILLFHIICG